MSNLNTEFISDEKDLSEIYWLLDEVLEKLSLIKQLPYEIYEPHEKLFLFSILSLSGIMNSEDQISNLIKELEDYKWRNPEGTIAFYLGILSKNYLKEKHGSLLDINELNKCSNFIVSKVEQFCRENDIRKIIDALFIQAIFADLTINILNVTLSKYRMTIPSEIIRKLLVEIPNSSPDSGAKVLFGLSILHELFDLDVDKNSLRNLSKELVSSIDAVSIEYRAFMLKALTILQMLRERQAVLKSLTDEYKKRFLHTIEKDLVKRLITTLSTRGNGQNSGIRFTDQGSGIVRLEIELSEEKMQVISSPNLIQLCLLALGLIVSGYHKSYTLPFHEQDNYIRFNDILRKFGKETTPTRLLILDRFEHNSALHSFLSEKFWPNFRNNLITSLILWNLILIIAIILLPKIAWVFALETIGIVATNFLLISLILKKIIEVSLKESTKIALSLFKIKSFKERVINQLREDFYNRISWRGG